MITRLLDQMKKVTKDVMLHRGHTHTKKIEGNSDSVCALSDGEHSAAADVVDLATSVQDCHRNPEDNSRTIGKVLGCG